MKKVLGLILGFTLTLSVFAATSNYGISVSGNPDLKMAVQDSPPTPPKGYDRPVVKNFPKKAKTLTVPTSTWTYGCSATSAGMLFGYYDRNGYPDMYTGPANGGVCPLTNLGQGIYSPISSACSIIATQNGFDGRTTNGHVDDYWISTDSAGPDPWESGGVEHTWGDCTADYMGTNQWKWGSNGTKTNNADGATMYYYYANGLILEDHKPDASSGLPQTALCHGMRLFAESRGYTVERNYNQVIDSVSTNTGVGFTLAQYKAEIDAGRPVLVHVTGHTMIGTGYSDTGDTIYIHDTWDNSTHSMTWGGSYSGMAHKAMTVFQLEEVLTSVKNSVQNTYK